MEKKKLLVLGGTYASLDVVKTAKKIGAYVIIADEAPQNEGSAKPFADECVRISTADISALSAYVMEKGIDGVFCGPSEFNIKNMIKLCAETGLPCYTDIENWERCADKLSFKRYCRENGMRVPERIDTHYVENVETRGNSPDFFNFPVIVKPSGGCSSKGITVCNTDEQLRSAFEYAGKVGGEVYAEEYIDNGGRLFSVRYFVNGGELYPYLMLDTYVVAPYGKKRLISALSVYPSSLASEYIANADAAMRRTLKAMELKNGTAFIQSIPKDGEFYAVDMGYRLSGGMMYKITEPLMGINDMAMMIRYALGGEMCTVDELERIAEPEKLAFAQLTIPLEVGKISEIRGLDKVSKMPEVIDILQYYRVGDTVRPDVIGTLGQHFARITLMANDRQIVLAAAERAQELLHISDENGNEMFRFRFDFARVDK